MELKISQGAAQCRSTGPSPHPHQKTYMILKPFTQTNFNTIELFKSTNHHTALVSPQLWCRSEPGGYWRCDTGPVCVNSGFHSSGARLYRYETQGSRKQQTWAYAQYLLRDSSAQPPGTHRWAGNDPASIKVVFLCRSTCLLHAHLLRHNNNASVAFDSSNESKADTCKQHKRIERSSMKCHWCDVITCVSRGGLDDCVSRFEDPGSLGVLYHPQSNPVLDAASCTEELTLDH